MTRRLLFAQATRLIFQQRTFYFPSPFSTADAEPPAFEFHSGHLTVRWTDWRQQIITILFSDALRFCWQIDPDPAPEIRDDQCYEVIDSPWSIQLSKLAAPATHHHYQFRFNAVGVLDVLAKSFIQEQ
jgi:hypothetical protein